MESLYLIDASGYLYRSYHAITEMTNDRGETTHALFGFIRSIQKLRKDFAPKYLAAIFDGPRSIEKRKQIYAEYKATRTKMPPDLRDQIEWAREFCHLAGIPELTLDGVEADDTMGAVAVWAEKQGFKSYLCTGDKDMAQLVNDQILLLNTHKDNLILDSKGVQEKFGVKPEQMIDYLALIGDTSDNIPGLAGFGPKTAAGLLAEHGSIQALIKHPEAIKANQKRETFLNGIDQLKIGRELITIQTEIDIPKEVEFYRIKEESGNQLAQFYTDKNFRSFLKEAPKAPPSQAVYELIENEKQLESLLEKLINCSELCCDTETTSEHPMLAELVGVGLSDRAERGFYIPLNGKLDPLIVIEKLKPLLENPKIAFFGHNLKYDYLVLKRHGITIQNIGFDTILASYILNSHNHRHSLDDLSLDYFGKKKIALKDLIGTGKKAVTMKEVAIDMVSEYCCEDVDYTFRLKNKLSKELKNRNLESVFFDIELPLLKILAQMEKNGIYLNVEKLSALGSEVNSSLEGIKREIYDLAGEEFNLNSPKQLSGILFDKLGINPPKKTATGYSTNAEVLESLSGKYPIAKKLIEYRLLEKLRSTYVETLPQQVNPQTRRIHCTYLQSVAATGRLSSRDPNIQNIPVRSEMGRKIRGAFEPQKKGWIYLAADYSQIELRLLAHLSQDPSLLEAFNTGRDIHAHTASLIFHVPIDKVTYEQRQQAKAVNFGVIYGQQAFGLSRELGIPMKEAKAFIDQYFERYAHVKDYVERCKELARIEGKAVTMTGRERLIPEITSKNPIVRSAAERLAVNTPLQGSAADLIKMAMLKIAKRLRLSMMILQIHDELIFEVPHDEEDYMRQMVTEEMESAMKLKVPLVVDVAIGKNWEAC